MVYVISWRRSSRVHKLVSLYQRPITCKVIPVPRIVARVEAYSKGRSPNCKELILNSMQLCWRIVLLSQRGLVRVLSENVVAIGETFPELFCVCTETFMACCRCRDGVKLFRFLLSPYSLIGTCDSVQNWSFRDWKNKVGLCNHHAVCVSVYPPINFWTPEPIFMKLGTYITAPEPIPTA
jgi:hypothetical protein